MNMSNHATTEAKSEWQRGWKIALSATIASGVGLNLYGLVAGIFVVPLQAEFGWTRAEMSASAILMLPAIAAAPILGMIVDKIGARVTAITGMVLLATCYVAMMLQDGSIGTFYGIAFAMGVVGLATTAIVVTRPINSWFSRSRGLALGITLSGVSITSAIMFPVLESVIDSGGWRSGYLTLALLALCVGAPVVFFLQRQAVPPIITDRDHISAASAQPAADGTKHVLGKAVRDPRLWVLSGAVLLSNLPLGGILSQLQPMLIDRGISPAKAALLGSVYAVSISVGRIGAGLVFDRFRSSVVAAAFMFAPICGVGVLSASEALFVSAIVAVALFGLAQGAEADFIAFLVPRYFSLSAYGSIFGILMMIAMVAGVAGGLLFAMCFDYLGSYQVALFLGALSWLAAALFFVGCDALGRAHPFPTLDPLAAQDGANRP